MHSCEVAVAPPPPIQGPALLFKLGTLIIEGRSSQLKKSAPKRSEKKSSEGIITSYGISTANVHSQEGNNVPEGGLCGLSLGDVHTRVLAAKFNNAKHFQKTHFSKDGGDGEKHPNKRSVSPSREPTIPRIQQSLLKGRAEALWKEQIPLLIDVLLAPSCGICLGPLILLERWTMAVYCERSSPPNHITSQWLLNAVKSQLHFSQISAWSAKLREEQAVAKEESPSERQRKLSRETCNFKKYESNCNEDELLAAKQERTKKKKLNVIYKVKPGGDYIMAEFKANPMKHTFPITDIGSNVYLMVTLESLPRTDEIPMIQCICSSSSTSSLKRRRSRDMANASDEVLAHTLANVCSLNDSSESKSSISLQKEGGETNLVDELKRRLKADAFSTELGAINPDKGCSSRISRKLSTYSIPTNSELLYPGATSRGSTSDNPEKMACASTSSDLSKNKQDEKQTECSYQSSGEDRNVPSDKDIHNKYLLLDDRMQTPCGMKGKHRCNCDDESDQGSHLKDSRNDAGNNWNYFEESGREWRNREMAKYLRRWKKDVKLKHKTDSGHSSREHSECDSCKLNSVVLESSKKYTASRHNDLSSKESGDEDADDDICHHWTTEFELLNSCQDRNSAFKISKMTGENCKSSEHQPATSIPILQASRFDHSMRFGSYRPSLPYHGSLSSRESYLEKGTEECACSSVGCDQMASVKICKNSNANIIDNKFHMKPQGLDLEYLKRYRTFTSPCNICNSDDNYTPVVKKMISSCTQTDDLRCDCGRSLVPKCFECSGSSQVDGNESCHGGMKRSWGSNNLVGIDKSALLLEAIERPSRVSESQIEEADTGIDAIIYCDNEIPGVVKDDKRSNVQVIENKCDNSFRDKNKLYYSCSSSDTENHSPCSSNSETPHQSGDGELVSNNSTHSDKTSFAKFPFAGNIDKAINFIRRPKLRRFMPIVDKLDRIVIERTEEKRKEPFNPLPTPSNFKKFTQNSLNGSISFIKDSMRIGSNFESSQSSECGIKTTDNKADGPSETENHVVIYEKGNYGDTMKSCMETKHGEKHSFEENERNCKHFRGDSESYLNKNCKGICNDFGQDLCNQNVHNKNVKSSVSNCQLENSTVPSVSEMDKFRCRLDSAASMVFHSRTGLPLTSSPAPLRRGKSSFDYDSSINSVSGIKSALYGTSLADLEPDLCSSLWSPGSSPGSPLHWEPPSPPLLADLLCLPTETVEKENIVQAVVPYSNVISVTPKPSKRNKFRHGMTSGLLGSFEESVLNGRLEPTATVAGFTAEIGASGSFCPQHLKLPVSVFFYSLGDNTTSAPYLGHINLGRRGYNIPKAGTIQVTLFNPHGTVVKMFVVMYDMADIPPNSKTFLRQKTLCVPAVCSVQPSKQDPRALRYLIHLRFLTSKSGKVYLHTDIRIIVSRKADMDTAQTLRPAVSLEHQQSVKKKTVETGTFRRRFPKDTKQPTADMKEVMQSISDFPLPDLQSDKFNHNNEQNGTNGKMKNILCDTTQCDLSHFVDDLTDDKTDGRIRRRSDSMDGLPKELSYELRSYTYGPDNPKYSPR